MMVMTCAAPVSNGLKEEALFQPAESFVKALPAQRNYKKPWYPTQISPCPLLMQCSGCKDYLPLSNFYTLGDNTRTSRQDILGKNHKGTCIACETKRYPALDPRQKLFYAAKKRAAEKNLVFTITVQDIAIPERCPVLGIKLRAGVGGGTVSVARLENSPTLDRIDNDKGYTPDNIAVISLRANNLKRDASLYEMQCLAYHMSKPPVWPTVDKTVLMNEITAQRTKDVKCSTDMKNYYKTDHKVKMLRAMKRRSKTYGCDGSITAQDVVIPEYCPVLGIKLYPSVGNGVKTLNNFYHSPSIDRIDSRKGYSKENIQVISFRANCLKRDASLWEIRALVSYMENLKGGVCLASPLPNDTTGGEE
jgi:hypothetical protein